MNPILMAATRGARIEWSGPHPEDGEWFPAKNIWFDTVDTHRRIHPDDEHLRFGPISTALREAANPDGKKTGGFPVALASETCIWYQFGNPKKTKNELHRSLFLLILSEALSDQGL